MLDKNIILHLTLIEDIGPAIIQKILERSDVQISDLYLFSISDWMHVFGLSEKTASKIVAGLSDQKMLEQELHLVEKHNIKWITIADESYPSLLKEIHLPPAVLYFQGTSFEEVSKCLAIVGARKATEYGQRVINQIVPDLVSAGYTIVSGGALGIDTMAHEAALACGGKTIAVLGSGLLRQYPHQNKSLFKKMIESGGMVASPYPLSMEPLPGNFPARNRIVTGLSRGCLVVQAAQKSGALISAHCALEQGRDVFAVPGLFDDELSAGCHEIIKQGAKLTVSAADVLNEFGDRVVLREQTALQQQSLFFTPSSDPSILFEDKKLPTTREASSDMQDDLRGDFHEVVTKWGQANEKGNNILSSARPACPTKPWQSRECPNGVYRRIASTDIKYSVTQQKIIAACKKPISCDDIIAATQLNSEIVQAELFNLQLEGLLEQDFMGMWVTY